MGSAHGRATARQKGYWESLARYDILYIGVRTDSVFHRTIHLYSFDISRMPWHQAAQGDVRGPGSQ